MAWLDQPVTITIRPVRECVWCNELVRELKDGRLAFHRWRVGWDQDRDRPIMGRCSGTHTSKATAEEAQREQCPEKPNEHWLAGEKAYHAGVPRAACALTYGGNRWEWEAGWDYAKSSTRTFTGRPA